MGAGIKSDYERNLDTAKKIENDSMYAASQRRKVAELLSAEQARNYGANNIEVSGSALQTIQEDKVTAELEALNEIYSGKFQATNMRRQAKAQKKQAYLGLGIQAATMAYSGGAFRGAAAAGALNSSGGGSATLNEVNQSKTSAKNYSGSSNRNLS